MNSCRPRKSRAPRCTDCWPISPRPCRPGPPSRPRPPDHLRRRGEAGIQGAAIENISQQQARERLRAADKARIAYVRRLYRCDGADASLYHLVIDSTAILLDTITELILTAARAHQAPISQPDQFTNTRQPREVRAATSPLPYRFPQGGLMTWRRDQLDRIAGSEELQITTTRPDGSYRRWTPIYVVRVGDGLYIRSGGGRTSDWYRHATQHNRARIRAGGIETDVTLQLVGDPALNAQVDAAYQAKYGISPASVPYFFKAPATEATLRLDS